MFFIFFKQTFPCKRNILFIKIILTKTANYAIILMLLFAGMMELADVLDSKSSGSDTVRVRPPLPAPYRRSRHKRIV